MYRYLCSVQWTEQQTLMQNYEANKFVLDPNEGFGRNKKQLPLKSKEDREKEDEGTFSDDDGECNTHHALSSSSCAGISCARYREVTQKQLHTVEGMQQCSIRGQQQTWAYSCQHGSGSYAQQELQ